jgi:DNA-binding NtrC family response regulator
MAIILIIEDLPENGEIYGDIVYRVEKELELDIPRLLVPNVEKATEALEEGLRDPAKVPILILLDMELPFKGHKDKNAGYKLMQQYRDQFAETYWVPLTATVFWHEKELPDENALFDNLYRLQPFAVFSKGRSNDLKDIVRRALTLYKETLNDGQEQERAPLSEAIKFNNHLYAMSDYKLYHEIRSAAETARNILLFGEPGTGKSVTAHMLHHYSSRGNGKFQEIDGMLQSSELEEVFFSTAKKKEDSGAASFSLKEMSGGTLYIRDVDKMGMQDQEESIRLQGRLLRHLTYKRYDVRIIGGINRNRKGFSLFDMISPELLDTAISLDLPLLCERKDDIPILLEIILEQFNQRQEKKKHKQLADPSNIYKLLQARDWRDGNVAQLRLFVEDVLLKTSGTKVTSADFEIALEREVDPPHILEVADKETGEMRQVKITKFPLTITDDDMRRFGIR